MTRRARATSSEIPASLRYAGRGDTPVALADVVAALDELLAVADRARSPDIRERASRLRDLADALRTQFVEDVIGDASPSERARERARADERFVADDAEQPAA